MERLRVLFLTFRSFILFKTLSLALLDNFYPCLNMIYILGEQRRTPLHSITGTSGSTGVLTSASNGVLNEAAILTKGCTDEVEVDTTSLEEVTIPLAVARSLKNIRKNAGNICLRNVKFEKIYFSNSLFEKCLRFTFI